MASTGKDGVMLLEREAGSGRLCAVTEISVGLGRASLDGAAVERLTLDV